ncbi:MAG: DNA glycosylase AlkZ-like family protein, partial [Mobilitalea sp.]
MLTWLDITALRMKRQYLLSPVRKEDYDQLFMNMSPVPPMYWTAPGDPPTLPSHADIDDYDYNSIRRSKRSLLKGRFAGGSIAYVTEEDLEVFACLYQKEITCFSQIQSELLELLKQEGPMNIGLMKELTGLLVKEITPALHKLQEAFIVYEDQLDNEGDRGWYLFESELTEV